MRLQKRALLSPSRGTFPSPQEAFSSSEATAVKASGRGNQPNEEDTFVSFSFFIVLMALPVVSVLFMCLRYMCERQSSRRERRERRERARAALRTHFVLASCSPIQRKTERACFRRRLSPKRYQASSSRKKKKMLPEKETSKQPCRRENARQNEYIYVYI